jgi:magnesium-transporting ATPase (P-type)
VTAQQKAAKIKNDLYNRQESRRAPKVQVDQGIVLWTWIVGIVVAFAASAVVSFNGITAVAQYVGLAAPWMATLFFFFIELMYVLFLIAYLVLQSRVDEEGNPERSTGAFWGMFMFGAIAVIANGFHTLDFWKYTWTNPQMWAGVVLSIAAPVAIISASKMASRVVFAKAIRL